MNGKGNEVADEAGVTQVGGTHYKDLKIQPWDYFEATTSSEGFEGYLTCTAMKYLSRYKNKNGLEDLQKAQHCLGKLIEVYAKNNN